MKKTRAAEMQEYRSSLEKYYKKDKTIDDATAKYLSQIHAEGDTMMNFMDCGWDYVTEAYADHTSKPKWLVWARFERTDDIVMRSYHARKIARIVETYYIDIECKEDSEYVYTCKIKGGNPLFKHLRSKKAKNQDKLMGFAKCDEDGTKMLFTEALDFARLLKCKLSEKDNDIVPIEYCTKFIQCGIHCSDRDRFHTIEVIE